MEIEEMQKQREAFEVRLRNVASEIVDEFQRRTGLMVTGVYIDLTEERAYGAWLAYLSCANDLRRLMQNRPSQ